MRLLAFLITLTTLSGAPNVHLIQNPQPVFQGAYTMDEARGIAIVFCAKREGAFYARYGEESDSMFPVFDENQFLVFQYLPERLEVGQVIAVGLSRDESICHRLESIQGNYLYLKGINNKYPDNRVHKLLYQGTFIVSIPFKTP